MTETGGSAQGERVLSRSEADEYAAELERGAEERDARVAQEARDEQRWIAGLASTCHHCGDTPRHYDGRRRLQSGGVGAEMVFGALSVSNIDVHVYVCQSCGSIEMFQDSSLAHPFGANASA